METRLIESTDLTLPGDVPSVHPLEEADMMTTWWCHRCACVRRSASLLRGAFLSASEDGVFPAKVILTICLYCSNPVAKLPRHDSGGA
jgi:hypothetical protein